ncbi:MAG: mercury resistance system periplasmic binding protein MerP [Proteobacteria bacterium]|nr:mercury resistance system periplasmic binding protein MerP [Pseudomonadota bacterium]
MKILRIFAALIVLIFFSAQAWAGGKTVTLEVEKMTCALCPYTVKTALMKIDGVFSAKISYENHNAVVVFDDEKTSIEDLTKATAEAGYPSHPASELKE